MPAERFRASSIRNKIKREDVHRNMKKQKGQQKLKRRLAMAEAEQNDPEARKARLAKNVPKTLDNMREYDPSMLTVNPAVPRPSTSAKAAAVDEPSESGSEAGGSVASSSKHAEAPEVNEEQFDENAFDVSMDPFSAYFSLIEPPKDPKVLITTSSHATKVTFAFCEDLVSVVPGSEFIRRKKNHGFEISRIAGWAAGRGYTSMIVVNEDRKKCNAMTMIHLPNGPTAYFKLTSVASPKEIPNHARPSPHHPELVLNNFVTRLGHLVGRMFQTLFPPMPDFEGRQVVTLHCQRDFLFFRRHRYMFKSTERTALQEIGPRFTLKLKYIKKGTPRLAKYGAPPPSGGGGLQFDLDDEEQEGAGDSTQKLVPSIPDAEEEEVDVPTNSKASANSLSLEEEYIWKWKPELETSRKTFFL